MAVGKRRKSEEKPVKVSKQAFDKVLRKLIHTKPQGCNNKAEK